MYVNLWKMNQFIPSAKEKKTFWWFSPSAATVTRVAADGSVVKIWSLIHFQSAVQVDELI